ncbi:MFS general substrate transporter [Thozetella sp. PMI_491]|nr:MFS general substrate transporter [Thozetella sp. PMI_491]
MICATASITGTVIQTAATTLAGMISGRIFVGCGIGMATNFILVYQSEISPQRLRGVLLGTFSFTVGLGSFVGTCVNQGTYQRDSRCSYRIPLLTQLACPVIFLCGAWRPPNSPRFLVSRGRIQEAYSAHRRLFGSSEAIAGGRERGVREIIAFVEFEKQGQKSTTVLDCFRGTDLRRTLIAVDLMTSQNFAGRDFLSTYGTYFSSAAGVSQPFLISVITNLVNLLASVGTAAPDSVSSSKVSVTFMILYSLGFQLSMGILASTLVSESASTRVRSHAQSVTVFTIRFMYGGFGILIFIFTFFYVPEYRNRSLEELDEMFMKHVAARQFKAFVTTGTVNGHSVDEKPQWPQMYR